MKITESTLLIDSDLNENSWIKYIDKCKNHDDLTMRLEGINIDLMEMIIPKSVSGILIKNCKFNRNIVISDLDRGRRFSIEDCHKDSFVTLIRLENINCTSFNFIDNFKDQDQDQIPEWFNKISDFVTLSINNSEFNHFTCKSAYPPEFKNVHFIRKISYTCSKDNDDEIHISFQKCTFHFGLNIKLDAEKCSTIEMLINESVCRSNEKYKIVHELIDNNIVLETSKEIAFKRISVLNSELNSFGLFLFNRKVDNVIIKGSTLGTLELYTSDTEDDCIFTVEITESVIDKLNLRNKTILHILNLHNTEFNRPPELLGASLPSGCIFPERRFFISKNGHQDAAFYRVIRHTMESQRDRYSEGIFFCLENESMLNTINSPRKYISLSYLYFSLSHYGTNYGRPLFILLLLFFTFSLINSIILSPQVSPKLPIDWDLVISSIVLTLKQIVLPFSTLREFSLENNSEHSVNYLYIVLGAINSLLSICLITLSALAIRWKFKRG